jgi:predicted PhzF superfamily epimerase YddE/YHI9
LLVQLTSRDALADLAPDADLLRAACDRLGLLGCYVYSELPAAGRLAARMFAPSIGVVEDIANANSTACLAAHLADRGVTEIAVDMGDSLGAPATITATARPTPRGPLVHLGGTALISDDTPSAAAPTRATTTAEPARRSATSADPDAAPADAVPTGGSRKRASPSACRP